MSLRGQAALNRLHRLDDYFSIRDYGLIADGATAAWLWLPRFGVTRILCILPDGARAGSSV